MKSQLAAIRRFCRLCQKDLRETLRDRRTLTTLLLMPLLVYPLLSLALNRLLLSAKTNDGTAVYLIGVESKQDGAAILKLLESGTTLVEENFRPSIDIYRFNPDESAANANESDASDNSIDGANNDRSVDENAQNLESSANRSSSLPDVLANQPLSSIENDRVRRQSQFSVNLVDGSLDEALRNNDIDLAIVVTQRIGDGVSNTASGFEVQFRSGDRTSVNAVEEFADILRLINDYKNNYLVEQGAIEKSSATQMTAVPIRIVTGTGSTFMAIIPLILLLMTITGAVYPAIDLTAGERERGTMESLIAAPISRNLLLMSKYVAVVTVALLTALANLVAMTVTLRATGIDKVLLGGDGISLISLIQILPLLILFACFFSAVLLALCSFAKSFKEAQAYLIPVMLIALAPGMISLMPGIEFTSTLAVVPLVNIILLSRDILNESNTVLPSCIAIVCTVGYTLAVIAVAARLFGADASSSGADKSWSELITTTESGEPDFALAMTVMAILFPVFFVLGNMAAQLGGNNIQRIGSINAGVLFLVFVALPTVLVRLFKIDLARAFRLHTKSVKWPMLIGGALLVAFTTWVFAYESFVLASQFGIGTLTEAQQQAAAEFKDQFRTAPLWVLLATMAIAPAVCEEYFFRGFMLSSMNRWSTAKKILVSSFLFGIFHVIGGNALQIERFIPSTLIGMVLAIVAIRTGSFWIGMVVHAIHNGFVFVIVQQEELIKTWGLDRTDSDHFPLWVIGVAGLCLTIGVCLIWYSGRAHERLGTSSEDHEHES